MREWRGAVFFLRRTFFLPHRMMYILHQLEYVPFALPKSTSKKKNRAKNVRKHATLFGSCVCVCVRAQNYTNSTHALYIQNTFLKDFILGAPQLLPDQSIDYSYVVTARLGDACV